MASKTICIKEEIFIRLDQLREGEESFSDLLERILTRVDESQNNYDLIMNEVFGSGKEELTDDVVAEFTNIQREIEENLDEQFPVRE
ncbi:MAG TPA: antitoxin VapB family protein [Candidatus Lokiarchaeia archaeon]|nr:antitoxin VapB family protein [Candidatus Lokiarchaeia archaeon]